MNHLLIKNIGQLLTIGGSNSPKTGKQLDELGIIENAFLYIKNRQIAAFGEQKKTKKILDEKILHAKIFPALLSRESHETSNQTTNKIPAEIPTEILHQIPKDTRVIDAKGQVVMPGLIDCHTHLIFGGQRAHEFSEKIKGTSYLEILKRGGGILSTVKATRASSQKILEKNAMIHLQEMLQLGITTIEAKSGYGLDLATELKILKIIDKLSKKQPIEIVPTFLGAHTTPPEFQGKSDEYLKYLTEKVLPQAKKYAKFCDIFCEKGVFSPKQSRAYLKKAKKPGFQLKIHADQLHSCQGAQIAADLQAISADHLDHISETGLKKLAKSKTIAVLLPGVPFFLKTEKYAPAEEMIKAGIPIAISTDFNPGSCPSKNLFLMMTFACLKMNITIEQAINAVTINAAHAIEKGHEIGSIEPGKIANLLILKVKDYREISYWMGRNLTETVIVSNQQTRIHENTLPKEPENAAS